MRDVELGPFALSHRIGSGGMGEVWFAVHTAQQTPVAIKVMTDEVARDSKNREAFRTEVRAVAGLCHPHVVMVLGYGEVELAAEGASQGKLVARSPWLAMELADGGTLHSKRGRLQWRSLRPLLLSLLDALAHAHARGIVHRDLKPGNILLGGSRAGPKISDFGLAQIAERPSGSGVVGRSGGTPSYMAPEQFVGAWRDYGPWTDLYALGCLAWTLAVGRGPYSGHGRGWESLQSAHMESALPEFRAARPFPPGFEDWLRVLLSKDPGRRFQRAADAAWALMQLPDETEDWYPSPRPGGPAEETLVPAFHRTTLLWEPDQMTTLRVQDEPESMPVGEEVRHARTPLPPVWERLAPPETPAQLVGTGLSLFGLRAVPMVGRRAERTALWAALRGVHESGRPQLVLLRGAAGCGKSRLAHWMCERAHEVGGAVTLEAGHGPVPGPMDGIGPMIGRFYRVNGLERAEITERLEVLLARSGAGSGVSEALALTEIVEPTTRQQRASGVHSVELSAPADRYRVIERIVRRQGRDRPVLMWLDDVQWGLDALQLADFLTQLEDCKVLLLLTVREEALPERPAEARLLAEIAGRPNTRELNIGPLMGNDGRDLVRGLLSLEDGLAQRLQQRAGGNPLFAVQLVGHWIQEGALALSASGFELREDVGLPADLHEVWSARVERFVADRHEHDAFGWEIAAALGQDVDLREWRAVCAAVHVTPAPGLLDALLLLRLSTPSSNQDEWRFAHGMLRESLERRARDAGRWTKWNQAAADILVGDDSPETPERIGRHLMAAEAWLQSLEWLMAAIEECARTEQVSRMRMLLDDYRQALQRAGVPEEDERWGERDVRTTAALMYGLEAQGSEEQLDELTARAQRHGWSAVLARIYMQRGGLEKIKGDLDASIVWYSRSDEAYAEIGDTWWRARCCKHLGELCILTGNSKRAVAYAERGLGYARQSGDHYAEALISNMAVFASMRTQKLEDAVRYAERCDSLARRHGMLGMIPNAGLALGTIAWECGDLELARARFQQARVDAEGLGGVLPLAIDLTLILLQIIGAVYESSHTELIALRTRVVGRWPILLGLVDLGIATCAAGLGRRSEVLPAWELAQKSLQKTGYVDPEVAMLAERLAELSRDRAVASGALELARSQWTAMDRPDRVAALPGSIGADRPS